VLRKVEFDLSITKFTGMMDKDRRCLVSYILILGFRRDVDEICGLLGCYAASCGSCLQTFRDNVSVPSSRVKSPSSSARYVCVSIDTHN
jgi:hypothetical protein